MNFDYFTATTTHRQVILCVHNSIMLLAARHYIICPVFVLSFYPNVKVYNKYQHRILLKIILFVVLQMKSSPPLLHTDYEQFSRSTVLVRQHLPSRSFMRDLSTRLTLVSPTCLPERWHCFIALYSCFHLPDTNL